MKLTIALISDLYDRCSVVKPNGLVLCGLRGATVSNCELAFNDDSYNKFNDTIVLLDFEKGKIYGCWDATCGQPGRYWDKHGTYSGANSGAPFTMPCGNVSVRTGIHLGKYWALIQCDGEAGMYPAVRDYDQDYLLEWTDGFVFTSRSNGINIHWVNSKQEYVEWASSGCHVMNYAYSSSQRQEFRSRVEAYESGGQDVFLYSVFDGAWLQDRKSRIFYGSKGDSVNAWQERLFAEGYHVTKTGKFDRSTHDMTVSRNKDRRKAGIEVTSKVDQWGVAIVSDSKPDEKPVESEELETWAKDAKQWAIDNGVSDGSRPNDMATRKEVWAMLQRLPK